MLLVGAADGRIFEDRRPKRAEGSTLHPPITRCTRRVALVATPPGVREAQHFAQQVEQHRTRASGSSLSVADVQPDVDRRYRTGVPPVTATRAPVM